MPNSSSNKTYVQGFYCESITFQAAVNMFECMEMSESIYEGVVEPSYKTRNRVYSNRAVHSRKIRGETASSNTYSDMSEISGNRGKST